MHAQHKLADRILRAYDYNIVHKDTDTEGALFEAVTDAMSSFPDGAKADLHAVLADLWPNYAPGMSRKIAVRIALREWRSRYQRFALPYQQCPEADQRDDELGGKDEVPMPQRDTGIAALIGGAE